MDLSNLKPAKGSVRTTNDLDEVKDLVLVEPLLEVTKEPNLEVDTQKRLVLKVVKCHFKDESLSLDLRIQTELSIQE